MLRRSIAICEELERVSLEADYLFMRCIPFLDVEGRMVGAPGKVRALVCPLRPEMTTAIVERCLRELHDVGLVVWYDTDDGRALAFPTFNKHNTVRRDRESASTFPPPPDTPTPGGRPEYAGSTPGVVPPEVKLSEVLLDAGSDARDDRRDVRPANPPTDVVSIAGVVVGDIAAAAVHWTAALNRGVRESKFGEQPYPIRHTTQHEAAERVLAAGVDVQWGGDWLYERAQATKDRRRIPHSLAYLADALIDAWRAKLEADDATTRADAFTPPAPGTAVALRDAGRATLAPRPTRTDRVVERSLQGSLSAIARYKGRTA
jgi:hypothetical protein